MGKMPGTIGMLMPRDSRSLPEPEVVSVVEEHLRHCLVGAGRALLGEHIQVVVVGRRLGMTFGIGRDGNGEATALFDAVHEVGGALVAVRVRLVRRAGTGRRVATQRNDPGDAKSGVPVDDHVDLCSCLTDASDVSGDVEAR